MTTIDPFGRTDTLDQNTLEALVTRFEARGKNPRFSQMLHDYLEATDVDSAQTVLDMGCATGLVARTVARRPDFSGIVIGIDLSRHLLSAARSLSRQESVASKTDFRAGDVHHLDFESHTFDVMIAHTLLSHVNGADDVVTEAARALKTGGMLGVFDGDYASLTFGNADPVKGKACSEALSRAVVANPHIMRQMPRLLRSAELDLVTSFSYVLSEVGTADFWSTAIETYRKLIPESGVMTAEESDNWAAALRDDSDAGVFFASCNYYSYIAKKPSSGQSSNESAPYDATAD